MKAYDFHLLGKNTQKSLGWFFMLKGAQKRMIVIKTSDSKFFEEAYFVVKPNCYEDELDMIVEADRIVERVIDRKKSEKKMKSPSKKNIIFCLCGAMGGIFMGILGSLVFKFPI